MSIDPSSLNLDTLPWVPLNATSVFPRDPAVYFAIDSQGAVQYVGRSINVRNRWKSHHRYKELERIGGVKIAYLFVDAPELLPSIESALIAWFNPPLNVAGKTLLSSNQEFHDRAVSGQIRKSGDGLRIRQIREIEAQGLGERIRQARLAISDSKSLEQICEEVKMSRTYWYDIEKETLKGALSIENLRKIEQALGVDFGVEFPSEAGQ